jgi:hypothetical protein
MKKILLVISLFALLGTYSCELDYLPYNAIEQQEAFKTIKDARTLRNYFPLIVRNSLLGEYYYATDIQADLLNATLSYGNVQGFLYSWDLYASDYTVENLWYGPYSRLKNVNNFIDNAPSIATETDEEAAELAQYISEAYLTRAILYRALVLRYAKDYEPATAADDPGVPLVLTYDINEKPARATVAEVYEQIFKDIAAAKTSLTVPGEQNAKYLTVDCITALEAQVYLETHQYSEAAAAAATLISSNRYPLITTQPALAAAWTNDTGTETIFQPASLDPSDLGNRMPYYINDNDTDVAPLYVPQQWVVDLFDNNDIRKGVFIDQYDIKIQGTAYPGVWLISKYPGNPALYSGSISNYAHSPKAFRIAELYLIRAEALAQSAATEGDALVALNALRDARGLTGVATSGDALKRDIQEERTREMLCEGTRLYDLKRWKLGVERRTPQNTAFVITAPVEKTTELQKNAGDDRFVWGIPTNDIQTNPNLEQNPGW